MLVQDVVPDLVESLVRELPSSPVIIDGFMIFTDGTMLQFTDNEIFYFGGE